MRRPFVRRRDGSFEVTLSEPEVDLVRSIAAQLGGIVDAPERAPFATRLFPPAYPEDADAQADYARMTEADLVRAKQRAIRSLLATLDRGAVKRGDWRVALSPEEAEDWLGVLNDARLTLGTRLDVTEETYEQEIDPDAPDALAHEAFRYLGWLEEHLVETLMR